MTTRQAISQGRFICEHSRHVRHVWAATASWMDCTHGGSFVVGVARKPNQPTVENVVRDAQVENWFLGTDRIPRWSPLLTIVREVRARVVSTPMSFFRHSTPRSWLATTLQFDANVVALLLAEIDEFAAVYERDGLILDEVARVVAEVAGRDQNALDRPLVVHDPVERANGLDGHDVVVPLGLDDELAAPYRDWVEGDSVHAAVPARLRHAHFQGRPPEYPPEEFAHEILEVLPLHWRKVIGSAQV